jgi:hypothetical protein
MKDFAAVYGVGHPKDGRYHGSARALYNMGAIHPPHIYCTQCTTK